MQLRHYETGWIMTCILIDVEDLLILDRFIFYNLEYRRYLINLIKSPGRMEMIVKTSLADSVKQSSLI